MIRLNETDHTYQRDRKKSGGNARRKVSLKQKVKQAPHIKTFVKEQAKRLWHRKTNIHSKKSSEVQELEKHKKENKNLFPFLCVRNYISKPFLSLCLDNEVH